jgi:hypothetical protein
MELIKQVKEGYRAFRIAVKETGVNFTERA